jgi:DNA-binding transcriptional regulator YhcF (GntR family)
MLINLRSKIRQRLLAYYFTHPKAQLSLRQLALLLKVNPGNLSREVKKLNQEGLLTVNQKDKIYKYITLNKNYPFYREIRSIFFKSVTLKKWKFLSPSRLKKTPK